MDFVSAIKTIKVQNCVTRSFFALLCDYGAFDEEERFVKGIVKQICERGFATHLSGLSAYDRQWETEVSDMMYRLTSQFGYREDVVSDIFHKLCLGFELVGMSYDWDGVFHAATPLPVSYSSASDSFSGFGLQSADSKRGCTGGHAYVDLGLPSGTLWATCNIGATKPEEYGDYYAWGETSTKNVYNWSTYKYCNGGYGYDDLTKYCHESDYGNYGFTDNLTELQRGDDPATANWGSDWCMPTKEQWEELLENTTNEWAMQNGVKGRLFTSKKNGKSLFLPAAGCRGGDELGYVGSNGNYWSSSLYTGSPNGACSFDFDSGNCSLGSDYRDFGKSVRAVRSARQN